MNKTLITANFDLDDFKAILSDYNWTDEEYEEFVDKYEDDIIGAMDQAGVEEIQECARQYTVDTNYTYKVNNL